MSKVKIKNITFGELENYVAQDCVFSNGVMKIEILGKNARGWEAIAGVTTNSTREVILQGESDKVLEQEIKVDFKTKDQRIKELEKENIELKERLEEVEGQYAYECGCNSELVATQKENEELKQRLKNAFVPKFKVGQEVWYPSTYGQTPVNPIYCNKIDSIEVRVNGRGEAVFGYKIKHKVKGDLYQIIKVGPIYLTKEEVEQIIKERENNN